MQYIETIFLTKEEFTAILKDIFFEHEQDRVWFKVTDFYYWDAEYYPPGADEPVRQHAAADRYGASDGQPDAEAYGEGAHDQLLPDL